MSASSWESARCAYIGVASNISPEDNIERALAGLSEQVTVAKVSTFYRTAPINRPEQPYYLNGAAKILTALPPQRLKHEVLRRIEAELGRIRTEDRYCARPIDLDLLLYGDLRIASEELRLPDPDVLERPFLIACLLELDPDLRLPGGEPLSRHASDVSGLVPDAAFTARLKERYNV